MFVYMHAYLYMYRARWTLNVWRSREHRTRISPCSSPTKKKGRKRKRARENIRKANCAIPSSFGAYEEPVFLYTISTSSFLARWRNTVTKGESSLSREREMCSRRKNFSSPFLFDRDCRLLCRSKIRFSRIGDAYSRKIPSSDPENVLTIFALNFYILTQPPLINMLIS